MVAGNSMNGDDEPRQRQAQAEIRDMLSTLTGRLAALGRSIARPGGGGDAEHGFGIITLAGENKGAMMKAEMEELMDMQSGTFDDDNGMFTYANSNYQAVNNSIILGGSTIADDPGVHVDMKQHIEEEEEEEEEVENAHENKEEKKKKKEKEEKKKKKKEKEEKKKKKKKEEEEEEGEEDEEKEKKKKKEEEEGEEDEEEEKKKKLLGERKEEEAD
ncbi:uncharacterized protein LOC141842230 [Curcuma longa]|uniref:uncharacterized protein LOC141842230 n=1 Tax=Curcuma longa TaxID=136217 RepID=UPI003D9DEDD5